MYSYAQQGEEEAQEKFVKVVKAINYYASIHFSKEKDNQSTTNGGS